MMVTVAMIVMVAVAMIVMVTVAMTVMVTVVVVVLLSAAEAAPRVKAMCTVVVQGSMLVGIDKMHVNVLGHA